VSHQTKADHHGLTRSQFEALARGEGGTDAIAALVAGQSSKHAILLSGVVTMARQRSKPDDRVALAGLQLLAQVQREDPAVAREVMSYPSVGIWALHTLRGDQSAPGARPSGLAAVAAAAALKAGVDAEIEVPVMSGGVMLPSLGAARAEGDTAIIRTRTAEIRSGALLVEARPGSRGWRELRDAEAGGHHIVIDDLDPFRLRAPECEQADRLEPSEVADLTAMLREAWMVLSPASAAEVAGIVRVIVPLQAPSPGHVSTSSSLAFGTVGMSRQPDKYTCAETLAHETQHLKLSALLDLVALTRPDDGRRYYAPWRADPRPASALLQGAYAFLGVSRFWRGQRAAAPEPKVRQRAEAEFARWRDGAALVVDTLLRSGQLTLAGADFVEEMARVLRAWQREPVPSDALVLARQMADRHLVQWHADNG
jgi:HEXXH motif-containing protein